MSLRDKNMAEQTRAVFFQRPLASVRPKRREFVPSEASANARYGVVTCHPIAPDQSQESAGSEGKCAAARFARDKTDCAARKTVEQLNESAVAKMMKKQSRCHNCCGLRTGEPVKDVGLDRFHRPTERLKSTPGFC